MCVDGNCNSIDQSGKVTTLRKGETLLIPAGIKNITIDKIDSSVKLLEIYIP